MVHLEFSFIISRKSMFLLCLQNPLLANYDVGQNVQSVKIAIGQKFRRSKLPSVKNSVAQNRRRSNLPSVKIVVGQNCRRSKWPTVKRSGTRLDVLISIHTGFSRFFKRKTSSELKLK
jgi:hypothetical protein